MHLKNKQGYDGHKMILTHDKKVIKVISTCKPKSFVSVAIQLIILFL